MLTDEPDETETSSGKLLPKDRRNSTTFVALLKSQSRQKLPFKKNTADNAVKIH
ncbi:hypothetical protein JCM18905_4560 [Vibrio sp. JCM 18905]|nr:hypothetical protein JCM18905_4560 [Vibrio sp. JCM 18905]